MDYTFRNIEETDYPEICKLPQTEEELFFMFPKAEFPLTQEQLAENLKIRLSPTVFLDGDIVIGFANFYDVKENESCWVGNLIVDTRYRKKGVGRFIVNTMENLAKQFYNVSEINIACFNDNTPALRMYHTMGYEPYKIEERFDKHAKCHLLIKMKKIKFSAAN